jgi:hypothetical protein
VTVELSKAVLLLAIATQRFGLCPGFGLGLTFEAAIAGLRRGFGYETEPDAG